MNYLDFIAIGVGLFPMMDQLLKLDIHFKIKSFPLKLIYNIIASLFSFFFFTFLKFSDTNILLDFPKWYIFLIIAGVLFLIYFFILVYKRAEVNSGKIKWPIILNLPIYVLFFVCLTVSFGLLSFRETNYVIEGRINNAPVGLLDKLKIEILHSDNIKKNITPKINMDDGTFRFALPKEEKDKYDYIYIFDNNSNAYFDENISGKNDLESKVENINIEIPK